MSSASTPPDLVFFIDYSLGGVAVPEALRAAGVRVEIHLDSFAPEPFIARVTRSGDYPQTVEPNLNTN